MDLRWTGGGLSAFERALVVALLATGPASGCATSASGLRLEEMSTGRAAFFGHVTVTNNDEEITGRCYAQFSDEKGEQKAYVSLDDTGWLFASANKGPTFLSTIVCRVGGIFRTNIFHKTREIQFSAPGDGKIAYFGHVKFRLEHDNTAHAIAALVIPVASGFIGGHMSDRGRGETVEDHFDLASKEYQRRYGSARLSPMNAMVRTLALSHAP